MSPLARSALLGTIAVALVLTGSPALADLADLHLRNGLRLRGDVTVEGDEVVLRNAAGEVRIPKADVLRIVPVESPATTPATQPATATQPNAEPPPAPVAGRPARSVEARPPPLEPAPPISEADIQRLRLMELLLDGPAESVRVRFERKGRQRPLAVEVLEELRRRPDFRPEWERILTRGQPHDKLQLIVRATGAKYAERMSIETDPAAFATFRRRVLPLVNRGCARSGCHSGRSAHRFRFPVGSQTGETYAYTTFVLLDQMRTADGPLINRANPEASILIQYMMPTADADHPHPPVGKGPKLKPVIRNRYDENHATVLDWINFLVVPRPEYGLEYVNPHASRPPAAPADRDADRSVEGPGQADK